jgi:hypothetical protein
MGLARMELGWDGAGWDKAGWEGAALREGWSAW